MFVYLLVTNRSRATYVGATVDLERRLRQHNSELVGGAKMTTRRVRTGEKWSVVCYVKNFPTWRSALQFEWKWKHLSRGNSIPSRLRALSALLVSPRSTSRAVPFREWARPPQVVRVVGDQ